MRWLICAALVLVWGCDKQREPEYGWMPPKPGWALDQFERDATECSATASGEQVQGPAIYPQGQIGTYMALSNIQTAKRAATVAYNKCMYAKGYWLKKMPKIPGDT